MAVPTHFYIRNKEVRCHTRLRRVVAIVATGCIGIVRRVRENGMREKHFRKLHRFDVPRHVAIGRRYGMAIHTSATFKQVFRNFECFRSRFGRDSISIRSR